MLAEPLAGKWGLSKAVSVAHCWLGSREMESDGCFSRGIRRSRRSLLLFSKRAGTTLPHQGWHKKCCWDRSPCSPGWCMRTLCLSSGLLYHWNKEPAAHRPWEGRHWGQLQRPTT